MNGEPFRGFESHPLRHEFKMWNLESEISIQTADTNQSMKTFSKTKSNTLPRLVVLAIMLIGIAVMTSDASAQRRRQPAKHLSICGNPNVSCPSTITFEPYALPFQMPRNTVIYDTELFYAVILKSASTANDNCDNYIPEPERLAAQALFPNTKVFTSRCAEPGEVSYSNTNPNTNFMAVYAGSSIADANRILATVLATRKFPGANIRRMRAMINGT